STTINLLFQNLYVNLSSAGTSAVGIKLLNTQQHVMGDLAVGLNGTTQIAAQTDGTGGFTGTGRWEGFQVFSAVTVANLIGFKFRALSTSTQIIGGSAALDTGASSICFDIAGANISSINPQGFNCNTANTAVKVESTSTSAGSIVGSIRTDSGVTNV